MATEFEPYQLTSISINEEITLCSNGNIQDELDLLTGQLTQRIGDDNVILEEPIIKSISLEGELPILDKGNIKIVSNEITPILEYQLSVVNYFVVPTLKPNNTYTIFFEGESTSVYLGGSIINTPTTKMLVISGDKDNILQFDSTVSKVMLIEGDLTNRDVEYFTGVKSSQKIEVQLRGNTPYFAKGGRK